jgi:16S rRNA (uracil1498-N3)-methyltransferase
MMRRFYAPAESFAGNKLELDENETRHLRDVLRLRAGDEVNVFDGEGREFLCRIETVGKRKTALSVVRETAADAPESPLKLTLAAAVLKGEKFDWVIQKAVELGVSALIPIETRRGDVKISDPGKKLERWRRITLEATKQCGRAKLMSICGPVPFNTLFGEQMPPGTALMFSERGGGSLMDIKRAGEIVFITGPEGGWTDQEIDDARRGGVEVVTLGGRIMRAETAAIAIAAVLQSLFGDLK